MGSIALPAIKNGKGPFGGVSQYFELMRQNAAAGQAIQNSLGENSAFQQGPGPGQMQSPFFPQPGQQTTQPIPQQPQAPTQFQPMGPYAQLAMQMAGRKQQPDIQQLFGAYRGVPPGFFNRGLI